MFVNRKAAASLAAALACASGSAYAEEAPDRAMIVVTASRKDLVGEAATASEGHVTQQEVSLRPIYRPGQLFESIPGLVVTIHSGEGKAQQYLIRGYNLDHGTDFANFVDDMPVNRPTNAHGQGYSDIAFLIPQVVAGIDYTKGPYHAAIGDFGSVASAHTSLVKTLPAQVSSTIGSDGYQELFAGGSLGLGQGSLLGAAQVAHLDGPWQPGQNFRKVNALLRYTQGSTKDGFSLTGMAYASAGRLITDQPERAMQTGLISRYGTLDPSDSSKSQRYSLSGHWDHSLALGQLSVSLYAIRSSMTLWNNFTHYLDDPVHDDQQQQDESRTTLGGAASLSLRQSWFGLATETTLGGQLRYDSVFVDRKHTQGRNTILPTCYQGQEDGSALAYAAVGGACNADQAHIVTLSPYGQAVVHLAPWLRAIGGLRLDYTHGSARSLTSGISGQGGQWLVQPKGSLIIGPFAKSEFYVSAGRGFHSNDVRGVLGTVSAQGNASGAVTPFLSSTTGLELGLRTNLIPRLSLQVAAFQQDFGSELTYNADSGQTEPGAPSRRQGVEISAQYRPFWWLELNSDLAFSRPRYRAWALDAYGLAEPYIADAPAFIYSAGALVNGLGRWSGALQWRRLGTHSLQDGQQYPKDGGYSEWNLDLAYDAGGGWKLQTGLFNLFNSRGSSASYYYTSRLQGEPAEGVEGYQRHPMEPRSLRFTASRVF